MNVAVGSVNTVKIQAVQEVMSSYSAFDSCHVETFAASSDVSQQPISMEEIIRGAKNRAKHAYHLLKDCDYSFGLESGLFEAPGTSSGYLETCICAIYTGTDYLIGMSCGIEIPEYILKLIFEKNMTLSEACYESGITSNVKLGSAEGIFGILTNGRIDRKEYTKHGIIMAMSQIENAKFYHR